MLVVFSYLVFIFFVAFSQTNDNNKLHSRDLDELKYEVQPVDVDALVQNNEGRRWARKEGQLAVAETRRLGGVADSGFVRCHIKWQTHLGDFFPFSFFSARPWVLGSKNKCSNLATQFV